DIDKETGSVAIGAVVTGDPTQVENGTYTDKVTFTASVVSATKKLTLAVSLIREIRVMDKTHIEIIFDYDDQYRECMEVIAGMENEDDMGKDYIPAGEKLSGDLSNEYVKRIFALFLEEVNYTDIAKLLRTEGIPSPLKYYYAKRGNMEKVAKVKDWDYSHVSRMLSSEYYIGNSVHGKQVKCLATGEKNRITDRSEWIRVEGTHEPLIDKETFEKVKEKIKEISARHPKKLAVKDPNYIPPPENKFSGKIFCGDCGARMRVRRQYHTDDFGYYCSDRRKKLGNCSNGKDILIEDVETAVFDVIKEHMTVCIDKIALVGRLNSRKENVMQYDVYAKEIAKLRREVQRISNNKGGLYEDYRDKLITAEELCQYQNEYEERIKEISGQIDILLIRQRAYEKDFHINEDWEETVNKYLKRRKLTKEMADVFVSKVICHPGGNIEVHLVYDDFMEELLKISEEREAENGR
ncbi:MAG: recombinase family protein, partial [Lachnospiraceae bacterium]|nr:recombinase family protein [Lachnospiraceae bacterium]